MSTHSINAHHVCVILIFAGNDLGECGQWLGALGLGRARHLTLFQRIQCLGRQRGVWAWRSELQCHFLEFVQGRDFGREIKNLLRLSLFVAGKGST